MCTAVTTSMPRTGVSGTRKPCWKDRSIPSAPFAALKRRTQLLRTDRAAMTDKRGDRYLRSLFTTGALADSGYAKIHGAGHRPWLTSLLARRPTKVAAIALANKLARMAWAIMTKGQLYKEPVALAA